VIGHRGAAAVAPENTVASFREGLRAGADRIELDVRLSRDGRPVVIHDSTLDRTTDGTGAVSDHSWDELRVLDAGAWHSEPFRGEPLPDLVSALQVVAPPAGLIVELKADSTEDAPLLDAVLRLLHDTDRVGDVVVSTGCWELFRGLREREPDLSTALVVRRLETRDPVRAARELGVSAIHPNRRRLNRSLARRAAEAGLEVCPYTVNDEAALRAAVALGVDGVITDDPARVRAWIETP
jgi:glycerophosphoryl diester phosphodiesterase